jgi:hypothetical protein
LSKVGTRNVKNSYNSATLALTGKKKLGRNVSPKNEKNDPQLRPLPKKRPLFVI